MLQRPPLSLRLVTYTVSYRGPGANQVTIKNGGAKERKARNKDRKQEKKKGSKERCKREARKKGAKEKRERKTRKKEAKERRERKTRKKERRDFQGVIFMQEVDNLLGERIANVNKKRNS